MKTKTTLIALTFLLAAGALLPGAALAQNSIAVNGTAAMGGTNFGLEVTFPGGSNSQAFVRDDNPVNESVYRAAFWYDPSNLVPNATTAGFFHIFARTTEETAFRAPFQLLLLQVSGLNRLFGRALTNSTAPGTVRFTPRINLTGANLIQVTWTQSDTPGVAGGNLKIEVLEGPQAGQCVEVRDISPGLNNSSLDVDNILLGAVGNISPSVQGSQFLDEFSSFRTLGPGGDGCP